MDFPFKTEKGDVDVPFDKIDVILNIRTNLEDLSSLMTDIKQRGLLQGVGLTKCGNKYKMVWGHRRFEACKNLGWMQFRKDDWKKCPDNMTTKQIMIFNFVENYHRIENSPIELGKRISELIKEDMTIGEVASSLSMPLSKTKSYLRLYQKIPEKYEVHVGYVKGRENKKGKISAGVAEKILAMHITRDMTNQLFEAAHRDENLGINQLRLVKTLLEQGMTLDEAMKYYKSCHSVVVSLVTRLNAEKSIVEKYGMTINMILKKIIKGEIPPEKMLIVD